MKRVTNVMRPAALPQQSSARLLIPVSEMSMLVSAQVGILLSVATLHHSTCAPCCRVFALKIQPTGGPPDALDELGLSRARNNANCQGESLAQTKNIPKKIASGIAWGNHM